MKSSKMAKDKSTPPVQTEPVDVTIGSGETSQPILSVTQEQTEEHTATIVPDDTGIDITLSPGTVLIEQVKDGKGTGVTFTVREREYRQYYSDTSKYIVKKKAI